MNSSHVIYVTPNGPPGIRYNIVVKITGSAVKIPSTSSMTQEEKANILNLRFFLWRILSGLIIVFV